jgi:hypothetical protein
VREGLLNRDEEKILVEKLLAANLVKHNNQMDFSTPFLERQRWKLCCCGKDLKHRMVGANATTIYDHLHTSNWQFFKQISTNIAVGFMSLTYLDTYLSLQTICLWKFDLYLDITYVIKTPIATEFVKHLLIASIALPYIYIFLGALFNKCSQILPRIIWDLLNVSHFIEVPYFQERNRSKITMLIVITTCENLIQLVFQTGNLFVMGANVGWFSLLSPILSLVLLIYAIHTYFIVRRLYNKPEYFSPMRGYYDRQNTCVDHTRNIVQLITSILSTIGIVTVVVVVVIILD